MDLTRLRLAVLLLTVLNTCQSPRTATDPIVPRPTSTQPLTPTPGLAPSAIPGSAVARLRVASLNEKMPDNRTLLTTFQYDSEGRLSRLPTRQTPDSASATVERSYNSRNQRVRQQHQIITPTSVRRETDGVLSIITKNVNLSTMKTISLTIDLKSFCLGALMVAAVLLMANKPGDTSVQQSQPGYANQRYQVILSEKSRTIIMDTQTGRFLIERPTMGIPGWTPMDFEELYKKR